MVNIAHIVINMCIKKIDYTKLYLYFGESLK